MRNFRTPWVFVGIAYILAIIVLFVRGAGILAAYLTMPAWLLVSTASLGPASGSDVDIAMSSWTGNLVLLVVSAGLNAVAVYLAFHVVLKGGTSSQLR